MFFAFKNIEHYKENRPMGDGHAEQLNRSIR